ncbi:MAG: hypothetical protein JW929_03365, partial [Anaerolineales bacterium]|nr:hypothetical protein [Anaerolineales bacterium]
LSWHKSGEGEGVVGLGVRKGQGRGAEEIHRMLKKPVKGVIASDRRERSNLLRRKKREIASSLRSSQ